VSPAGLLFTFEAGDRSSVQIVGNGMTDYTAAHPKDSNLHSSVPFDRSCFLCSRYKSMTQIRSLHAY
jgi:hypothetical protein